MIRQRGMPKNKLLKFYVKSFDTGRSDILKIAILVFEKHAFYIYRRIITFFRQQDPKVWLLYRVNR